MAGWVKLYLACKAANMKAYPGFEGYLIDPDYDDWENPKKNQPVGRYHFGLLAINEDGYKALVKFMSMTHTRPRFNRFPRCTLSDLFELGAKHGDDLVFTTGCFFGLIQQHIVKGEAGKAKRYVEAIADAFPNTFVEVQHHNICHDDDAPAEANGVAPMEDMEIVDALMDIAEELDLPVIATQDSHYLDHKHKVAHTLMKKMVYASSEDGFPGDSFHLASTEWVAEHYEQDQWDIIEEGFDDLIALWDVRIEPLDNYRPRVPTVVDDPNGVVRERVEAELEVYLDENPHLDEEPYWDQAEHEFDVIEKLGMAPYFVIVEDYVRACQERDIMVEARGSANGSIAAFGMGITQVDSIERGGMFERFLSLDRTKPPDVDLDIEDTERGWLIGYLLRKYRAVQIGTYSQLGSTIDKDTGEEKGSVLQTWLTSKRRECEALAKEHDAKLKDAGKKGVGDIKRYSQGIFARTYGDVQGIEDVKHFSRSEYRALRQLVELGSVYKSYGVHAGGVLLSGDDVKIEDYIPTMLVASSDTRVTQFDMDDVEAFGLLKMDILGQSSLRMMKLAQQNIAAAGHVTGAAKAIDFTWIEDDDPNACKLLREGRLDTGLFHYEGYTKAKGGKELRIKTTEDAIMGQALYMPGAMDTGQTAKYVERRRSREARKAVTYISEEFRGPLEKTYGTVIFQEQVIDIMRNLGMDIAGINKFFKVVKDSGKGAVERNRERMAEVRAQFESLCLARGITDVDAAWAQTAGFVSYGFNRAHASGYGIRSYRTAYLKAYYPTEFMAALLQTWAGRTKERRYIAEARRIGVRLLPPDVNISSELWTMDYTRKNVVRKGLLSIPGVGAKAAKAIAAQQPFTSMEDMIARVDGRAMTGGKDYLKDGTFKGIVAALNDAGALESLLQPVPGLGR